VGNNLSISYPQLELSLFPERLAPCPSGSAAVRELAARYADNPARRIAEAGAGVVSNAELLIGLSGISYDKAVALLRTGWTGLMAKSVAELRSEHGLTERQARVIVAAVEVAQRIAVEQIPERMQIKSPADVAALLMIEMGHLDQEHLRVVLLDTKNRVQEVVTVYIGSVNSAAIRVGEVFKAAIRRNSTALIVAHNHPSGDPTPSPEDILVTRQIVEAGKLLDCEVLDHLIVAKGRHVSMRERGLGFSS
jgi:DNA repair protein RadC